MDLSKLQQQIEPGGKSKALPPVDKWDPPFCGDINMRIERDGRWFYENSPIGRAALVRLFSSVLKYENQQYFLVTPVEKVGISVEDVPFVIIDWQWRGKELVLRTQIGDEFVVGEQHPCELRLATHQASEQTLVPYVNVRRNLWGRLHQNVYYQLLELAECEANEQGQSEFSLQSGNYRMLLGVVDEAAQ